MTRNQRMAIDIQDEAYRNDEASQEKGRAKRATKRVAKPKAPSAKQLRDEAAAQLDKRIGEVLEASQNDEQFPIDGETLALQVGSDWDAVQKRLASAAWKSRVALIHAKESAAPLALAEAADRLYEHPRTLAYLTSVVSAKREATGAKRSQALSKFLTDAGVPKPCKHYLTAYLGEKLSRGELGDSLSLLVDTKLTPAQLVVKLLEVLKTLATSVDHYPVSEAVWIRTVGPSVTSTEFKSAMKVPTLASSCVACKSASNSKQVSYLLRDDVTQCRPWLLKRAFDAAITASQSGSKSKPSLGFTTQKLADALLKSKADQQLFIDGLWSHLEKGTLDEQYGTLFYDGDRILFRRRDIVPQLSASTVASVTTATSAKHVDVAPRDVKADETTLRQGAAADQFAHQFEAAFEKLDKSTGGRNFVKLLALRDALPQFTREQFDAGLKQLRLADRYTMDSAFGASGSLSEAERSAGIQEGLSLLVYVSRK